jgi:hypothetical protein
MVAFLPSHEDSILFIAENVIDVIFLIDIAINFRTTYFSWATGDEIMNTKLIAKHYISSGQFFLDLLATVPFDLIVTLAIEDDSSDMSL